MVLSRLPSSTITSSLSDLSTCVSETFLAELKKRGEELTKPQEKKKRRKRLNVRAGKSILASDVADIVEKERKEKKEKKMAKKKENAKEKKNKVQKSKKKHESEEEDTDISDLFSLRDSDDSMNLLDLIQDEEDEDVFSPSAQTHKDIQQTSSDDGPSSQEPSTSRSDKEAVVFNVDQFVVVNFEGTMYPGLITENKTL